VIRAIESYIPQSEQELGFEKGDFFHVVGNENDTDWYEACNPATNARGFVPVPYFQVMGKNERDSQDSNNGSVKKRSIDKDSGYSDRGTMPAERGSMRAPRAGNPLYGVVLYDFNAERPDELEAKTGEDIIVIAQSNEEWFVAKPIGRLGGPGLIPVDFVEIRDMSTGLPVEDTQAAVVRAGVPKVEEWKKMAAEYKNSSIALGQFEFDDRSTRQQNAPPAYDSNGRRNARSSTVPCDFMSLTLETDSSTA
jgi:bud emergence protein 1